MSSREALEGFEGYCDGRKMRKSQARLRSCVVAWNWLIDCLVSGLGRRHCCLQRGQARAWILSAISQWPASICGASCFVSRPTLAGSAFPTASERTVWRKYTVFSTATYSINNIYIVINTVRQLPTNYHVACFSNRCQDGYACVQKLEFAWCRICRLDC